MVAISGGQFMMGDFYSESGRPIHRESVADFAIGQHEVTFDEWEACVRGGGCRSNPNPNDQGWGRGRRPVINVSWNDAQEYVLWLSAHTGQSYRLPNDAEWEYADQAPRDSPFSHHQPGRVTASSQDRDSPDSQGTVPVGSYQPNYFGIHDKPGNVDEWVQDEWEPDYRVRRGLNWRHISGEIVYQRTSGQSDEHSEVTGFRVARALTGVRNPNPLPTPLSGPLEPPLEGGYYVYDGFRAGGCGENQSPVALTSDVALHASRNPATPIVAIARSGETVTIVDCRVHFRPIRGEVLRTDYGFEAGRPVYLLYDNKSEWDTEDFEHTDVIDFVWHQGDIISVNFEYPEDLFSWAPVGPGMSGPLLQDGAGGGCWYQLETRGVRAWGQSADLDCFWTRRRYGAAEE